MKKLIITLLIVFTSSICISAEVYEKVDNNTIQVEKVVTETKTTTHSYKYLLSQKAQIERDLVRVQAELVYIEKLIAEAGKLGIIEKVKINIGDK